MATKSAHQRIYFALKVHQHRLSLGFSFAELAERTQLSISYLNEIEKGKKFPKPDKIEQLARVFNTSIELLLSETLPKNLEPIEELLKSNFLNELPLDIFGFDLMRLVELIADAPTRVGAFIATLVDLSRGYAGNEAHFYFAALRSYLEINYNFFEDIETAALKLASEHKIEIQSLHNSAILEKILKEKFNYKIIEDGLSSYPDLNILRAVTNPRTRTLLLNKNLTTAQRAFQFGKELGFCELQLKERAYTSSLLRVKNFDEVLNHFKAGYFSAALLMPQKEFIADIKAFFLQKLWNNGDSILGLLQKYNATPEMFFQRMTNILPQFLNLEQVFFLRFLHTHGSNQYEINKELHLSRKHHPQSTASSEHYCRRWLAIKSLENLEQNKSGGYFIIAAQLSAYNNTNDIYLCITIARRDNETRSSSVTIGILIEPDTVSKINFLDDPEISSREVSTTCERCAISDCLERQSAPTFIIKKEKRRALREALNQLMDS